ncbi:NAD(P)-dependent oxidoreductase [Frankia sp. Cas3]|uniref:NAD(P)-dependent oxidoreductase n=1 Tax=Frankia sp. Cas3 TaxID=3073926 RepID=UPI002AD4D6A2|nr:NAD(P)-dependent oxidoreductase [Frankia sp. Cas3]
MIPGRPRPLNPKPSDSDEVFGTNRVATAARIFDADVMVVARRARLGVHELSELPALLPDADVVVLALPNTPETTGLVDAAFLAGLPDGASVVNVARGALVVTEALLAELNRRRLFAFLDVFEVEPIPAGDPLWSAPNLVITPHIGGGRPVGPGMSSGSCTIRSADSCEASRSRMWSMTATEPVARDRQRRRADGAGMTFASGISGSRPALAAEIAALWVAHVIGVCHLARPPGPRPWRRPHPLAHAYPDPSLGQTAGDMDSSCIAAHRTVTPPAASVPPCRESRAAAVV